MALIFREGLKNETFRTVVGTPDYIIQPTNMNSQQRILHTHHLCLHRKADFTMKAALVENRNYRCGRAYTCHRSDQR